MRGTFQLLFWLLAAGLSTGWGIRVFSGHSWILLLAASLCWLAFVFHLADAAWLPSWGQGRDWIDRMGILIRGLGFASVAVSMCLAPGVVAIVLSVVGLATILFGRALWELATLTDRTGA